MTDKQRLAEIKTRLAAAAGGPWELEDLGDSYGERWGIWLEGLFPDWLEFPGGSTGFGSAEFIAHAREDIPWLVSKVEQLIAELEKAERVLYDMEQRDAAHTALGEGVLWR